MFLRLGLEPLLCDGDAASCSEQREILKMNYLGNMNTVFFTKDSPPGFLHRDSQH